MLTSEREQLPNCRVTSFVGTEEKECWQCEKGYTYDENYQCVLTNDTTCPSGDVDECSFCIRQLTSDVMQSMSNQNSIDSNVNSVAECSESGNSVSDCILEAQQNIENTNFEELEAEDIAKVQIVDLKQIIFQNC